MLESQPAEILKRIKRERKNGSSMRRRWPTKRKTSTTLRKSTNATWRRSLRISSSCAKNTRESSMNLSTTIFKPMSMSEASTSLMITIRMNITALTILMPASATSPDVNANKKETKPLKSFQPHSYSPLQPTCTLIPPSLSSSRMTSQ